MKHSFYYFLFWFGISFGIGIPLSAQNQISLEESRSVYALDMPMAYIVDSTHSVSWEDIRSGAANDLFRENKQPNPNFGFNGHNYWFKIKVRKPLTSYEEWMLKLPISKFDTVDFYQLHKNGEVDEYHTGDAFPFAQRAIQHKSFLFPLRLKQGESSEVYVRIGGYAVKLWPSTLVEKTHFIEENTLTTIFNIFSFGILMGLLLYNLLLYFGARLSTYLYYVCYLFFFLIVSMALQGYAFQLLFRTFPFLNNFSVEGAGFLTLLFACIFSRKFLNVKEWSPFFYKAVHWIEYAVYFFFFLLLFKLLHPLGSFLAFWVLSGLTLITVLVFVSMSILGLKKGVREAKFYGLAWGFAMLGVVVVILRNTGVLPDSLITQYAFQIGAVIEASLLSLGLSDRIKTMEREKQLAQETTITTLKENERIVKEQNVTLERVVAERTEELNVNLEMLSEQKVEIEKQNKDIVASINYASRIQKVILPLDEDFESVFGEENYFIYYQPKDIVSGDFYWLQEINGYTILVVADCTGHGVPGALMSIVGHDLLNNVILTKQIWQPDLILRELQEGLELVLKSSQTQTRDGMDLAVCAFDRKAQQLYYAGAGNPLVIVEEEGLKIVKPNRQGISGKKPRKAVEYNLHQYPIVAGNMLYLYTDGYQDQFGGERSRKFMAKSFRSLLHSISVMPLDQQKDALDHQLKEWMKAGKESQIDDITVVGIRL